MKTVKNFDPTMTAGELIEKLKEFPPETPVMGTWEGICVEIVPDKIYTKDFYEVPVLYIDVDK